VSDVAVVIVTHNSADQIEALLESLPPGLGGLSAHVVVVDNGSTDATVALVRNRPEVTLVEAANEGYAAGINRGVALSSAAAVLVLNPDVRLAPDCVPRLLKGLDVPGTGIVVPQLRSGTGQLEHSLRREPRFLRAAGLNFTRLPVFSEMFGRADEYATERVVDWATGAVMLVSRECHDRLGGWDESFFLYSEETDFCLRARDLGLSTRYRPEAVAVHLGGGSGRTATTHTLQVINRVRLYRRRHSRPTAWAFFAITVASEVSWILRGQQWSRSAVRALLRPAQRPAVLHCSDRLLPR
jgi:N-acetylglucosaminyl-diphospho-decaprenol L-rhamnosyltransferase